MHAPPEAHDVDEQAELERLRREVPEFRMVRIFLKHLRPIGLRERLPTRGGSVAVATGGWTLAAACTDSSREVRGLPRVPAPKAVDDGAIEERPQPPLPQRGG